jgi:anti-sigma factor RsiW
MSTLMSHEDVWHRIPWYVNGRADEAERQLIEAHVRQCDECKAEVTIQRQVMNAIATDTRIDCMPGMSFQRLWDRIRTDEAVTETTRHRMPPAPPKRVASRSVTRWLAAAVVVEAVGLTAMAGTFFYSRGTSPAAIPAEYRTLTSSATAPSHGTIRAVFSPTLAVNELQRLLEKSGLQIVAGPTEAGVYTLAAAGVEDGGTRDRSRALATLRADPAVQFAEPISK